MILRSTNQQFDLSHNGNYSVGRGDGSSLLLNDSTVSRQHGWLHVEGQDLWVQDSGSTNGTRIDGRPIEPGKWVPVPSSARLSFGTLSFNVTGALVGGPLGALLAQATKTTLETEEVYNASLAGAARALEGQPAIVDLPRGVPTLVLSDLHARRDFLVKALSHEVGGEKVIDLLKAGKVNVVCIGDGMHAEGRAQDRWLLAEQDALANRHSNALDQEMVEGLGTMKMVMDLKSQFPANFHFLRGNHDEVKGNFCKYSRMVGESALVKDWMVETYGEDFLEKYAAFEESLPLVARGDGFVYSHAAPGGRLDRAQIEARDPKAFAQVAWTDNTGWNDADPDLQGRFQHNLAEVGGAGGRWMVGHRPVRDGLARQQFGGQLVQINAPNDFVVALVPPRGADFNPEKDVFSLR